jgi:hypothetical protein
MRPRVGHSAPQHAGNGASVTAIKMPPSPSLHRLGVGGRSDLNRSGCGTRPHGAEQVRRGTSPPLGGKVNGFGDKGARWRAPLPLPPPRGGGRRFGLHRSGCGMRPPCAEPVRRGTCPPPWWRGAGGGAESSGVEPPPLPRGGRGGNAPGVEAPLLNPPHAGEGGATFQPKAALDHARLALNLSGAALPLSLESKGGQRPPA